MIAILLLTYMQELRRGDQQMLQRKVYHLYWIPDCGPVRARHVFPAPERTGVFKTKW